jgi:hypothetical protein
MASPILATKGFQPPHFRTEGGRPVKLISAIKSMFTSFFPLLLTVIIFQVIISLICIAFGLFMFLVVRAMELLGHEVEYSSPYFVMFSGVLLVALIMVLVYLQVIWSLVSMIVVVESRWGFEPLSRSVSLVKGMRCVALSLLLIFWGFAGIDGLWCGPMQFWSWDRMVQAMSGRVGRLLCTLL